MPWPASPWPQKVRAADALVLRFGPASEWLIWPIPSLLSPFVGVFYPLETLPGWMRIVAYTLPPSYVFESMRALVAGQPPADSQLAIASALALLDILLAAWFFGSVYKHAVRTGLIARYSAESLS